jgi:predicted Zn-dependent peptidase
MKKLCIIIALALAGLVAPVAAQQSKGVVIKGRAPVSKELLKVKFPRPVETTLSNGLRVMILENHKIPTFNLQLIVMSGGMANADDELGVAQFTASLLREGTKSRSSKQIAEELEGMASTLFAGSGLDSTTSNVSASGLVENFDKTLALFADVLMNPTFPADEFGKLKTRTMAQLTAQRAQAGFLAQEQFAKAIYGKHPAARASLTVAALNRLTPEALQRFHATYYRPNNAMLAIAGDVNPKEVVANLEKTLAGWAKADVPTTAIPTVPEQNAAKIYLIDRPGSVQTNIVAGAQSLTRTDPDYYAVQVMNAILGGSGSARLFLNLREDKGYTYGAYSNIGASEYRGTFAANTEVRTEVTDGSMKELFYEFNRIRDEKVPNLELENAKRAIVGQFALRLESPAGILGSFVTLKRYGLPDDYWDTYPARIAAVTADDVQRVARKYIALDKLQVVAVGDAKQINAALRKYGTVEVMDTEGRPAATLGSGPVPPPQVEMTDKAAPGFAGKWQLSLSAPGQDLPGTLTMSKDGDNYKGAVQTMLGEAPLSNIKIEGNRMTADISVNVQGQTMDGKVTGSIAGNEMKGEVALPSFPPIPFTGKRQAP